MLKYAACGGNVSQHDQLAFVHDAHGLHLLHHSINQVWRLREFAHLWPQRFPQLGLLSRCQCRLSGAASFLACGLRALRRKLLGELVPSANQRALPAEFGTEGGDDGGHDLVAGHGAGASADRFVKQLLHLRQAGNA